MTEVLQVLGLGDLPKHLAGYGSLIVICTFIGFPIPLVGTIYGVSWLFVSIWSMVEKIIQRGLLRFVATLVVLIIAMVLIFMVLELIPNGYGFFCVFLMSIVAGFIDITPKTLL